LHTYQQREDENHDCLAGRALLDQRFVSLENLTEAKTNKSTLVTTYFPLSIVLRARGIFQQCTSRKRNVTVFLRAFPLFPMFVNMKSRYMLRKIRRICRSGQSWENFTTNVCGRTGIGFPDKWKKYPTFPNRSEE